MDRYVGSWPQLRSTARERQQVAAHHVFSPQGRRVRHPWRRTCAAGFSSSWQPPRLWPCPAPMLSRSIEAGAAAQAEVTPASAQVPEAVEEASEAEPASEAGRAWVPAWASRAALAARERSLAGASQSVLADFAVGVSLTGASCSALRSLPAFPMAAAGAGVGPRSARAGSGSAGPRTHSGEAGVVRSS